MSSYRIRINSSRNKCFGYLLVWPHWGHSNKYPECVLWVNKNKTRSFLTLYNSSFILMTSLETGAVVVTRFHSVKSFDAVIVTRVHCIKSFDAVIVTRVHCIKSFDAVIVKKGSLYQEFWCFHCNKGSLYQEFWCFHCNKGSLYQEFWCCHCNKGSLYQEFLVKKVPWLEPWLLMSSK